MDLSHYYPKLNLFRYARLRELSKYYQVNLLFRRNVLNAIKLYRKYINFLDLFPTKDHGKSIRIDLLNNLDRLNDSSRKILVDQCNYEGSMPNTMEKFAEWVSYYVNDDWLFHIYCVIVGAKKLALVEYGYSTKEDIIEGYRYGGYTMDFVNKIKDYARIHGIKIIYESDGTPIYYNPEYIQNVYLLEKFSHPVSTVPEGTYEIIRSLLLGYSIQSIKAYQLMEMYNRVFRDEKEMRAHFQQIVRSESVHGDISRRIIEAKKWIIKNGGIV